MKNRAGYFGGRSKSSSRVTFRKGVVASMRICATGRASGDRHHRHAKSRPQRARPFVSAARCRSRANSGSVSRPSRSARCRRQTSIAARNCRVPPRPARSIPGTSPSRNVCAPPAAWPLPANNLGAWQPPRQAAGGPVSGRALLTSSCLETSSSSAYRRRKQYRPLAPMRPRPLRQTKPAPCRPSRTRA